MEGCYVMTKDQFMKSMDKTIKDDEIVIFSTIKQGCMKGASKKRMKSFETGFSNDCFKDPETITDVMKSFSGSLISLKKEFWSKETEETYNKFTLLKENEVIENE